MMDSKRLATWLVERAQHDFQLSLSTYQCAQFADYYRKLIEVNRMVNLTAIVEEEAVYLKHFYDSLTLCTVQNFHEIQSVIDVGTGAGFPGIPLKIAFPHLKVVLLDSLQKRVRFLDDVIHDLKLSSIEAVHGRAEEFAHYKTYREQFDVAVSRAVARLHVLSEYCLPFVSVGGQFIAMKGAEVNEEIREADYALHVLGKVAVNIHSLQLPVEKGVRHIVSLRKRDHTPKRYPRKAGLPTKQPLLAK